jgi:hypothetical protein
MVLFSAGVKPAGSAAVAAVARRRKAALEKTGVPATI